MLGFIDDEFGGKRPLVEKCTVGGGAFLVLRMEGTPHPHRLLPRLRAGQGADKMAAAGVREAVFPVDFPYTTLFLRRGIAPVDPLPLRRALAVDLVRRRLEVMGRTPGQAVVALAGDRVTRSLAEMTRALALRYRYVLLSVRSGGEELSRRLRREYGVSLLPEPSLQQLEKADALVLHAPREELTGGNPVFLALYPGGEVTAGRLPVSLPLRLRGEIARRCDGEQMAAALWQQGAVTKEELLAEIP